MEKSTSTDKPHRKVLITGAHSYIGESFEKYAKKHYADSFDIDTIDMVDGAWKNADFSPYDTVYHVAGIAHADVGKVSDEIKKKYYDINTTLAIDTAKKAKSEGVKQFVFMSSMIVYGESAGYGKKKVITRDTAPSPANFYGDSKWQADKGVRQLGDENFKVAVLRPPMIYGKGSKGNYPVLAKLAKKLPIFPKVNNERSMLYIENLCEFLCQIILLGKGGIYFPQNEEYTNTCDMVKKIAEVSDKKIKEIKVLNPAVLIASKIPVKIGGLVNKAFGNMTYEQGMSKYPDIDYQLVSLDESIIRTEGATNGK
jgi:UDP-glucose 4-epimerase